MKRLGREIIRPEINWQRRLWVAARDFGWVEPAGMGGHIPVPLSSILPAVGTPGSPIETWREAVLVSKMCRAFKAGLDEGTNPLSIPPWER